MCVIAYKAKDVRFPSDKNIRDMWNKNPDGAGIMWREDDGTISFVKGFMKLKDFQTFVEKNIKRFENRECALHFRITTHGGTSEGNCHPFVIEKGSDSHALSGNCKRILMHNGVLPIVPRKKDISDSAELAIRLGEFDNPCNTIESFRECLSGNRIILMDENGTHFFGDKFKKSDNKENKGILYSNLSFESNIFFRNFGSSLYEYGRYYDYSGISFEDSKTSRKISIDKIDPTTLYDDDFELWDEYDFDLDVKKQNAFRLGLSLEEYDAICMEAEEYCMDPEEYYKWFYEGDESYCPYHIDTDDLDKKTA